MARDVTDSTPITSRDELVAWIAGGARPPEQFRIGTEHEKIPFHRIDRSPVQALDDPQELAKAFEGLGI